MSLAILNVGDGDTKITFDKDKPDELERSKKIVTQMIRAGFAIMVLVGTTASGKPKYRRATKFDPDTCEYIIVDAPDDVAAPADEPKRKGRGRAQRVPAAGAKAVGVARSAGGCARKVWM